MLLVWCSRLHFCGKWVLLICLKDGWDCWKVLVRLLRMKTTSDPVKLQILPCIQGEFKIAIVNLMEGGNETGVGMSRNGPA